VERDDHQDQARGGIPRSVFATNGLLPAIAVDGLWHVMPKRDAAARAACYGP
jgi:hypothetical protein